MVNQSISYVFTHIILPGYIFSDEKAFLEVFSKGEIVFTEFLQYVWQHSKREIGEQDNDDDPTPDFEVYVEDLSEDVIMGIVKMPKPNVSPDPLYIGIAFGRELPTRYFTYELATSQAEKKMYMVGEWTKEREHINFHSYDSPNPIHFVNSVSAIIKV